VHIPNSADTLAVGSYPAGASPYGVLDMAANVYEWVADWYDADYYRHSPGNNPTGPESGQYRVLRSETNFNISSYDAPVFSFERSFYASGYPRLYFVGFRCARSE
jgi:eukaryotic-like serine/threonine-protein kinase